MPFKWSSKRVKRQIRPVITPSATDDDLVLCHLINLPAVVVFILDGGVYLGPSPSYFAMVLRGFGDRSEASCSGSLCQTAGAIGFGGQRQLGVDDDIAALSFPHPRFPKT